jgi:hypothetical protein
MWRKRKMDDGEKNKRKGKIIEGRHHLKGEKTFYKSSQFSFKNWSCTLQRSSPANTPRLMLLFFFSFLSCCK